jgi:hypothetical protein
MVNNYRYLYSFCKKVDVSIRASQGFSQASTTPPLVSQSQRQDSVLTCPVTPSYNTLSHQSSDASGVIRERFRSHRLGVSSTRDLPGVAPRLHGPISGCGKNVYITVVRIHHHTLYLDQGYQGLGSTYESTRDTLSLVHRRLSTRSTLPVTCFALTEDCRRSFRVQWSHTGSRQGCLGAHSDSPRSSGCGDLFQQCQTTVGSRSPNGDAQTFRDQQGHPVSVHTVYCCVFYWHLKTYCGPSSETMQSPE